jgi:hypothetical protein
MVMVCGGDADSLPAIMTVPKTSVDEYDFPQPAEDNIRIPRKVFPARSEPKSHPVDNAPHNKFGSCVATPNRAHDPTSSFWCLLHRRLTTIIHEA